MLVGKGEFAKMVGRSAAAVSQWIASGKLAPPALVGEGRFAKIDVDAALAQLGLSLDLGQQLAQSRPILGTDRPALEGVNDDQARLLKARADREALALEMDRAKAAEMAGRWLDTAAAEAAWSTHLAGLVQAFDTWLVTTAAADVVSVVAGGGGPREAAKVLRDGFRELRRRLATAADIVDGGPPAAPAADVDDGDDGP